MDRSRRKASRTNTLMISLAIRYQVVAGETIHEDLMDRVTYKLLFFLILQVQVTYRSVLKDPVS